MATEDLLDHFKLEAEVLPDCTVHSRTQFDRRRGARKRIEVRWNRLERIGDGAFGQVWLEEHTGSNGTRDTRAIKIIEKHKMRTFQIDYKKELLALAKFSKEEYRQAEVLVSFLGWFETEQTIFLAMEYFEQGDLGRHISQISTENEVRQITVDLLEGLKIIHAEGFAHRDLKPQNIFVVERPPQAKRWWVKIGDFGISKRVKDENTALRTQTGTPLFQAPEIWGFVDEDSETSVYSKAVDLWSLGCIVYNISAGKVPFSRSNEINAFCRKRLQLAEEPLSRTMSTEGIWFVKHLLVPEPTGRMSIERALEDLWVIEPTASPSPSPSPSPSTSDFTSTAEVTATNNTDAGVKAHETGNNELDRSQDDTVKPITKDATVIDHGLSETTVVPAAKLGEDSSGVIVTDLNESDDRNFKSLAQNVSDLLSLSKGVTATMSHDETSIQHEPISLSASAKNPIASGESLKSGSTGWLKEDFEWQRLDKRRTFRSTVGIPMVLENGKQLVCADSGTDERWSVALWDIASRKMIKIGQKLGRRYYPETNNVVFSPDGKVGAFDFEQDIVLFDLFSAQQLHRLQGHKGKIKAITISSTGTWIATGSVDCTIRVWSVANGQLYRSFTDHGNVIVALTFSANENLIVSGSADRMVRLWDTMNAKWPQSYRGHTADILSVAISPDGTCVASSSIKSTILLWDRERGLLRHTIAIQGSPHSIAFSPDSKLIASSSSRGSVSLFDVGTGKSHSVLKVHDDHISVIRSLAFIRELGMLVATDRLGTIGLWAPIESSKSI